MTHKRVLFVIISVALTLAACSAAPTQAPVSPTRASVATSPIAPVSTAILSPTMGVTSTAKAPVPTISPSAIPTSPVASPADLVRTDAQGYVEFDVTPVNLSQPGETLDFEVGMNTHSVNLSWDLAAQSQLTTDTGREVKGQSWPVGGGHHVSGTLSFPAKTADGKPLLAGAKKLTLTIQNAGAPERTFVWDLTP
jgi:hypothetical protein